MDLSISLKDFLIRTLEAGQTQMPSEQIPLTGFDYRNNNNNTSLTESRVSLQQQQQTSKQFNYRNSNKSNKVLLTKSSSSAIKSNKQKQIKKRLNCKQCKASFFTDISLSMHIEKFHKSKNEFEHAKTKANQCETSKALFECCGKVFNTEKDARQHLISVHIGLLNDRKVTNSFQIPGTVSKSRQNEHPNQQPKHRQLEHQVTGFDKSTNQSSFNCFECDESFKSQSFLDAHRWCDHSQHLVYQCEVRGCDKKFITDVYMIRHYNRNIHKGVNFPCDRCIMFINRKDGLRQHLQTYHEIDLYPPALNCPECDKFFNNKNSVDYHLKKVHPEHQSTKSTLNQSNVHNGNYDQLNLIPPDQANLFNCDKLQVNSNDIQLGEDNDGEIEVINDDHQLQQHQEQPVTSTAKLLVKKPLLKCKWEMCNREFVNLQDLQIHVLDVHVREEYREDSVEMTVKALKADEQPIEQTNPIKAMNQDEQSLDVIVNDEQSCHISHDHDYHQTEYFSAPPLNASLRCSFAECSDLTFDQLPSLHRHTRLKHSESLHPRQWKPFRNSRRTTQSNHVLKIVLTSKIKCSMCDKWFKKQNCLEIHVIQEHMVRTVVTCECRCIMTFEDDDELARHRGVHQQPFAGLRSDSNEESMDETESNDDPSGEINYDESLGEIDSDEDDSGEQTINETDSNKNESNYSGEGLNEDANSNGKDLHQPELRQPQSELSKQTNECKSMNSDITNSRPFKSLHSDKSFKDVDDLGNHFEVFHNTVVSYEFSGFTRTFVNDDKLERYREVHQQSFIGYRSDSNKESMDETESDNDSTDETNYEMSFDEIDSDDESMDETESDDDSIDETNYEKSLDGIDSDSDDSCEQIMNETDTYENETNDSDKVLQETADSNEGELQQPELQQPHNELYKPTNECKSTSDKSLNSDSQLLVYSNSNEVSMDEMASEDGTYLNEQAMEETGSDEEEFDQSQHELNKLNDESKSKSPDVTNSRPFKCLHCDESFKKVGDMENHFEVFHKTKTAGSCEFSGFTRTFINDDKLGRYREVHQQSSIGYSSDSDSNEESMDETESDDDSTDETNYEKSLDGIDSDEESMDETESDDDSTDETNYEKSLDGIDSEEEDSGEQTMGETDSYENETNASDEVLEETNSNEGDLQQLELQQPQRELNKPTNESTNDKSDQQPLVITIYDSDEDSLGETNSDLQSQQPEIQQQPLYESINDIFAHNANQNPDQSIITSLDQSIPILINSPPIYTLFQYPNIPNYCVNPVNYVLMQSSPIEDISNIKTNQSNQPEHEITELTKPSLNQKIPKSSRKPKCHKASTKKRKLSDHIPQVHSKPVYPCELDGCGVKFKSNFALGEHYRTVHKGVNFPCQKCEKSILFKDLMLHHLQTYHAIGFVPPKREICPICRKSFKSEESVTFHLQNVHTKPSIGEQVDESIKSLIENDSNEHSVDSNDSDFHSQQPDQQIVDLNESININIAPRDHTIMPNELNNNEYQYFENQQPDLQSNQLPSQPVSWSFDRFSVNFDQSSHNLIKFDAPPLEHAFFPFNSSSSHSNSFTIQPNSLVNESNCYNLAQSTNSFAMPVQQQSIVGNVDCQQSLISPQTLWNSDTIYQKLSSIEQQQVQELELQDIDLNEFMRSISTDVNFVQNVNDNEECMDYLEAVQIEDYNECNNFDY